MTILLINALRAAETLASFHQEQAGKMPPDAVQVHHQDMAQRCLATSRTSGVTSLPLAPRSSIRPPRCAGTTWRPRSGSSTGM
jgi:hypothetical protein